MVDFDFSLCVSHWLTFLLKPKFESVFGSNGGWLVDLSYFHFHQSLHVKLCVSQTLVDLNYLHFCQFSKCECRWLWLTSDIFHYSIMSDLYSRPSTEWTYKKHQLMTANQLIIFLANNSYLWEHIVPIVRLGASLPGLICLSFCQPEILHPTRSGTLSTPCPALLLNENKSLEIICRI